MSSDDIWILGIHMTKFGKYPDKDLGILVYSEYSRPLVKVKQLHPNVFPMMAPIRRCRLPTRRRRSKTRRSRSPSA